MDNNNKQNTTTHQSIKKYYSAIIKSSNDLQTNACCCDTPPPLYLQKIIDKIHPEIKNRFYGCGSPIPILLKDKTVLDLGCGTGRDVFILSCLVGDNGKVIGVDMTESQLETAKKYIDYHQKAFNLSSNNCEFKCGFIEDLNLLKIENNSIDVVISNCVINLSPFKEDVFAEIFRVLKNGGELYFSDVFSDRRIPYNLKNDEQLLGECLAGALYREDFRRIMQKIGFNDFRIVEERPLKIVNKKILKKTGNINFFSLTIRAFKIKELEDRCEDYGQVAIYKGGIPNFENKFVLDKDHIFYLNKPELVCKNTALILEKSRFKEYFSIIGDATTHFGLFKCKNTQKKDSLSSCC